MGMFNFGIFFSLYILTRQAKIFEPQWMRNSVDCHLLGTFVLYCILGEKWWQKVL